MKKILFVITDNLYIRNFIESGVVRDLSKHFKIEFLINKNIKKKNIRLLKKKIVTVYDSPNYLKYLIYYQNIKVTNLQHRSLFFSFRLKRLYRHDFRYFNELKLEYPEKKKLTLMVKFLINASKGFLNYHFFKFLSFNFLFFFIKKLKFLYFKKNSFIKNINRINPDLVLMPTSGYDPDCLQILDASKTLNIKSYLLIDNWDNLSTKIIFDTLPDQIGVWGSQTKNHAKNIQKIKDKNITILGSARAQNFFKQRNILHDAPYKDYILFLGSAWAWDEEKVISMINQNLEKNKIFNKNTKLIYRPHPYRQRKTIIPKNWNKVIIDKQISNLSLNSKNNRDWPELEYYPSLLQNCRFIVGGLTSMILESTIFWKNYLAIGFDDNQSLMNQKNALKYFLHLKGIDRLPNVTVCNDVKKFDQLFGYYLRNHHNKVPCQKIKSKIDAKREYFLKGSKKYFSQDLIDDINKLI